MSDTSFNQDLIKSLLDDRKRDRLWRNIRFIVYVLFMAAFLSFLIPSPTITTKQPYVALVRMTGIIMPGQTFSARTVIPNLIDAFKDKQARGVVLLINSPGGSPVQASIIHDKIIQLKHQYHKEVIVVAEDMLASGAYLVATAADKIYVNPDTITGSIGVIMEGFGFTDAIKKLGVSRRVFTAGTNKDRLDSFLPLNPTDVAKVQDLLNEAHENFIEDVIDGRSGKLKGQRDELFSGDFWTGKTAAKLGLVDGTADLWTVLQQQFNVEHYKDYSVEPGLIAMLIRGTESALHLPDLGEVTSAPGLRAELG